LMGNEKILDVGCGINKMEGAIGIDINPNTQADVVHDLNKFPYPFPDSEFDSIICTHIVEHIDDIVSFMEEIHRIGKPNALVKILTPHFSHRASYTDPTHKHHLAAHAFDFFIDEVEVPPPFFLRAVNRVFQFWYPTNKFYTQAKFELVERKLLFSNLFRWLWVGFLANSFVDLYEFYFAFIFPARDMSFVLKILK